MAQRVNNFYRLVTVPKVYEWIQSRLGGQDGRRRFASEMIRAEPGIKMLDVGCGPAAILDYLPALDYIGIDLNQKHVDAARLRFGTRGRFFLGGTSIVSEQEEASFDLILVSALLHHLSDAESRTLFASLQRLIKPDGRIVTIDCVWLPRQRLIAKTMNHLDSGLNVRTPDAYERLLDGLPFDVETRVYHDLLAIPYDHFCMTLRPMALTAALA